ncbi:macrophage mannose receptor 1-like [Paramacrobiotus metropolitanus]|uniref:macrophage mannose receptor 1-like n=1 Tax=Paramacrobiotus metropolitanus TaxID=2943436 RepID=UPI00244603CA|nr:macrophage mannose receptor 1-like [Paramacrobiotus metropolitanus]
MSEIRHGLLAAIILGISIGSFTGASRCPGTEWFSRPGTSDCYYVYVRSVNGAATGPFARPVTFENAFEECKMRGGKLFVPSDRAEMDFVGSKLPSAADFYWIGMTYQNGRWQWTDDSGNPTIDFNPSLFPSLGVDPPTIFGGVPNEYRGTVSHSFVSGTADFFSEHKNSSLGFICSGTFSGRPWCKIEDGWIYDSNKCYLHVAETNTYAGAQANCRSKGGFVSAVNTDREDARMREWMRNRLGMRQAWLGVTIPNKTSAVTIDTLKFDDGESINNNMVNHWNLENSKSLAEYITSLPNDKTYCGEIYSSEEEVILIFLLPDQHDWSLRENCESRYPYACETPKNKCPYGWEELGEDCYQFNDGPVDWSEARRRCTVEKADLVSIRSSEIQNFLRQNILSRLSNNPNLNNAEMPYYWTGGSKRGNDPNFKWTDGSSFAYQSWSPGQPLTVAITGMEIDHCAYVDATSNGNWNASVCTQKMGYVCAGNNQQIEDHPEVIHPEITCEEPFKKYHDGCYYHVTQKRNRDAAQEFCANLPEKSNLLTPLTPSENFYAEGQAEEGIWLGIKATSIGASGGWIHRYGDGSIVMAGAYHNYEWGGYIPSASSDRLCTIMKIRDSDCDGCDEAYSGDWIYVTCTQERNFICYHDGKPKDDSTSLTPLYDPECGAGWIRRGDQCYKTNADPTTWKAAKSNCQNADLHGDLLSIVSKEEELFIRDMIVGADFIGPLPAGFARASSYWINFYSNRENFWFWPKRDSKDQYAIPAVVFNWGPGQPDNSHDSAFADPFFLPISDSNPRCAYVEETPDALWADGNCAVNRAYICKKPTLSARPPTGPPPTAPSGFGCLPGHLPFGTKCLYRTPQLLTWTKARDLCRNNTGELVSFDSQSEYQSIAPFTQNAWIGLNSLDNPRAPRVFSWSDNAPVQYAPWDTNVAQGHIHGTVTRDVNCVAGGANGINAYSCEEAKVGLCESFRYESSTPPNSITIPQGDGCEPWGVRWPMSNSCFYFGNDPNHLTGARPFFNFDQARQFCQTKFRNGDLATILNEQEKSIINALVAGYSGDYWIGLKEDANPWSAFKKWVDGTAVTHTNWGYGQPPVSPAGSTGCVAIQGTYANSHYPGDWFVDQCTTQRYALCKAPATTPHPTRPPTSPRPNANGCPRNWITTDTSSRCYKAYYASNSGIMVIGSSGTMNKAHWDDAEAFCGGFRNGHLASIDSQAEQTAVQQSLPLKMSDYSYWIGLRERSVGITGPRWGWSDGTPYTLDFFHMEINHEAADVQDCAAMDSVSGRWIRQSCSMSWGWVCEVPKGAYMPDEPIPALPTALPTNQTCGRDTSGMGDWYYIESTNECLFVSARSDSWENAQATCRQRRSHLTILNPTNNREVVEVVSHMAGALATRFYIGLRITDLTLREYSWLDGKPLTWNNWAAGQPLANHSADSCVSIDALSGKWSSGRCAAGNRFLCSRANREHHGPPAIPTRDPQGRHGGCADGWVSFGPHCYYISPPTHNTSSWGQALQACAGSHQMKNSSLVSIMYSGENDFLISQLKNYKYNMWIGLHETDDLTYEWTDRHPFFYNNWHYQYPRPQANTFKCIAVLVENNKVGRWFDAACNGLGGYICKAPKDFDLPEHAGPATNCTTGFSQYGDACFKVIPLKHDVVNTWGHAEQLCRPSPQENIEGGLATILDVYENAFVRTLFNEASFREHMPGQRPFEQAHAKAWIGMKEEHGHYEWFNKCPAQFANLANLVGTADDSDCVDMNFEGKWHAHNCTANDVRFAVCERRFKKCEQIPDHPQVCPKNFPRACANHCYETKSIVQHTNETEAVSFEEARRRCVALGGDLASVRNEAEQKCIHGYVQYAEIGMWIGLRDTTAETDRMTWQWVDNNDNQEPAVYANWQKGEPNMFNPKETCVEMYPNGLWNNARCEQHKGFICQAPRNRSVDVTAPTREPFYPTDYTGGPINTSKDDGYSGGQIAGIVIGVLLAVAVVGAIGYVVVTGRSSSVVSSVSSAASSFRERSSKFVSRNKAGASDRTTLQEDFDGANASYS